MDAVVTIVIRPIDEARKVALISVKGRLMQPLPLSCQAFIRREQGHTPCLDASCEVTSLRYFANVIVGSVRRTFGAHVPSVFKPQNELTCAFICFQDGN